MAVAMLSSPGLTRRVLRLLARRRTPAFAPHWMMIPAALAVVVAVGSGQVSVFGVQIAPMALVEAQIVSVTPSTTVGRIADAPQLARTPKPASTRPVAVPVDAEGREPEAGSRGPDAQQATTTPAVEQIEEPAPTPMPLASSTVPATVMQPPAVVPEATVNRATVSGEAKQAWAAATQAGESIGLSSRKGAVATAGFFTRLSKKVATSF